LISHYLRLEEEKVKKKKKQQRKTNKLHNMLTKGCVLLLLLAVVGSGPVPELTVRFIGLFVLYNYWKYVFFSFLHHWRER
jgi:hypothetical protein